MKFELPSSRLPAAAHAGAAARRARANAAANRRYGSISPHGLSFHKNKATKPQRETADPPMSAPDIGGGAKR